MEKVDIFDQEVGRAAIECNGNLVVVFNGKKAFWFKEQIESFVKEHPEAPLPLSVFCVAVSKVGEPCASTRAQAIPSVSWLEAFPAVKHCRNIKQYQKSR